VQKLDAELLKVINLLKEQRRKKEELQKQEDIDEITFEKARGRITALTHAIIELEYLHQTGEVKE
jgi:hypothetical protein